MDNIEDKKTKLLKRIAIIAIVILTLLALSILVYKFFVDEPSTDSNDSQHDNEVVENENQNNINDEDDTENDDNPEVEDNNDISDNVMNESNELDYRLVSTKHLKINSHVYFYNDVLNDFNDFLVADYSEENIYCGIPEEDKKTIEKENGKKIKLCYGPSFAPEGFYLILFENGEIYVLHSDFEKLTFITDNIVSLNSATCFDCYGIEPVFNYYIRDENNIDYLLNMENWKTSSEIEILKLSDLNEKEFVFYSHFDITNFGNVKDDRIILQGKIKSFIEIDSVSNAVYYVSEDNNLYYYYYGEEETNFENNYSIGKVKTITENENSIKIELADGRSITIKQGE